VHSDDKMVPVQAHGIGAMSMGLLMDSQSAAIWRGPMVMSALNTFINRVHWGPLDVLVIDMPPGTGDAQISISQRLALSGAVIVTTPQELALMDARRGITMFRKVNVPILGIVENMSSFICGCCGSESFIFGKGGADAEALRTKTNVLGHVPLHIDIRATSDEGEPIVVSKPESLAAQEYMNIARKVWNGLKNQLSTNAPPEIHVT
jgi:ATP-binding protein involved in chromosome partitioning